MVALAESPEEWAAGSIDLVLAGIEQFNEGSLARAATMLDLAERMLIGKERFQDVVNAIGDAARAIKKSSCGSTPRGWRSGRCCSDS